MVKSPNILLPGAGGFAAINAIKSLRKIDYQGRIITTDSNLLSAGFYLADKGYVLPKIKEKNFFEEALEIIKKEKIELILPTSGFDIIPYSQNKNILKNIGVTCFFSDIDVIDLCNNKYNFYKRIEKDFPTPKFSLEPNTGLSFPVFAKPIAGKGSRNTFLINSENELQNISSKYSDMIYCEYLPGKEYTIDVLSDLEGKAIKAVPRERIETKDGISFKGKILHNQEIENLSINLVEFLKLKGPSCLQMKEDVNGKLKLLEINPRMGGGTIMATLAGVNIPKLILDLYNNVSLDKSDLNYEEITVLRYYEEIVISKKNEMEAR